VSEVFFDARAGFANPMGNVQGGFLAAMLDDTLGPALAATLGDGEFAPTLELKVSFLRPAGSPAPAAWSIAADPSQSWPGNCVTRLATCWPPRQRRSGLSARTDIDTGPGNPIVADTG